MEYIKRFFISENFLNDHGDLAENALKAVVDYFSEEWLIEDNKHPLQILWQRNDNIAFSELFTLGNSINYLKEKNDPWLIRKIEKIMSNYHNTRIGAVFEVLSSAMIDAGRNDQKLIFPKKNNPGYDFTVVFENDNGRMNVSCKNFGFSNAYNEFNKQSKLFEKYFVKSCRSQGINDIQFLINTNIYPRKEYWDYLKLNLDSLLKKAKENGIDYTFHNYDLNEWQIAISRIINDDGHNLYKNCFSYSLLIVSSFQKNERINILSKLEDALNNIIKGGRNQNNNEINILFIHLNRYASLDKVEKWSKEYLKNNKDKPIAGIIFVQPYVERDYLKKTMNIAYGIRPIYTEYYKNWFNNGDDRLLELAVMIGNHYTTGLTSKFIIKNGIEANVGVDPNSVYFYQRGKHYLDDLENKNIKISVSAPGIHEYRVYRKNNELLVDEPIIPKDENLILI